jgi:hypothetical protein
MQAQRLGFGDDDAAMVVVGFFLGPIGDGHVRLESVTVDFGLQKGGSKIKSHCHLPGRGGWLGRLGHKKFDKYEEAGGLVGKDKMCAWFFIAALS